MEHYLLIGTEDAYQKARFVLQERHGNCNVVSTAFINKLDKWPEIGPKDTSALREFSGMLDEVLSAKNTIPGLSVLDYAKENVKLPSKLLYYLETKWRDAIKQWRHTHGEASYPTFVKFADFIREAAEKANIPELEGLATSSSPRFNRNPKPKPDNEKGKVVPCLHQLRVVVTVNQTPLDLVNQRTLVQMVWRSVCFVMQSTS